MYVTDRGWNIYLYVTSSHFRHFFFPVFRSLYFFFFISSFHSSSPSLHFLPFVMSSQLMFLLPSWHLHSFPRLSHPFIFLSFPFSYFTVLFHLISVLFFLSSQFCSFSVLVSFIVLFLFRSFPHPLTFFLPSFIRLSFLFLTSILPSHPISLHFLLRRNSGRKEEKNERKEERCNKNNNQEGRRKKEIIILSCIWQNITLFPFFFALSLSFFSLSSHYNIFSSLSHSLTFVKSRMPH